MKLAAARLLLSLTPAALGAQTGGIVGYLVARGTGDALAHGIVGVETANRSAFTSDSGWFSFRELTPGQHLLRVRRLGFSPREVSFVVRDGITDTLRVELSRVAVQLGTVDVKAYPPCVTPGAPSSEADSTMAAVVEQIRLNAEQYTFLAEQYPYWYLTVISRSSKRRRDGEIGREPSFVERYQSSSKSTYKPGAVIQRRGRDYIFQVPTLVEVADKSFVDAHCWHYGGTEVVEDEPLIRVDAVAFDSLRGPDVNGTFFVSSRTFQIRRSVVHLSRRPTQIPELVDMEVTSEFFEVLPSIPIIEKVHSVQTIDPKRKSLISEAYEDHTTTRFTWVKRAPGDDKKP